MRKRFLLVAILLTTGLPLTFSCKNSSNPTSPAPTPTNWAGYTSTATSTKTNTPTITQTPTITLTPTITASPTITPTNLGGFTSTATVSYTSTSTVTSTFTATFNTPTMTFTPTQTFVTTPSVGFKSSWLVSRPNGLALLGNSNAGTLFVAEGENSEGAQVEAFKIVNHLMAGAVTTWTKWGPTSLVSPEGVAVSPTSQVYVLDAGYGGSGTVFVFNSDGTPVTYWSSWSGGTVTAFNDPTGIAVDANGNVYVADAGNTTIEEFSQSGIPVTQWNNPVTQWNTGGIAGLCPVAVACGPGTTLATVDDGNGSGAATINLYSYPYPAPTPFPAVPGADLYGLAFDSSGNLYVADSSLNPTGQVEYYSAGLEQYALTGGTGSNAFVSPDGVVYDISTLYLFVSDYGNGSNGQGTIEVFGP